MANLIQHYHDFPKQNVDYFCVQNLLLEPTAIRDVIDRMESYLTSSVTKLVALDARGFIFASMLAERCKLAVVLVRKDGKLPGECHKVEYKKEYGQDIFCLQKSSIQETDHVVIVDDVLATGGTASAAFELVKMCNATVESFIFVLQIGDKSDSLNRTLHQKASVHSVFYTKNNQVMDPFAFHDKNFDAIAMSVKDPKTVVFYHPESKKLAFDYISYDCNRREGIIEWKEFADGWPNIKFETPRSLHNKHLVFIMNLEKPITIIEQLCVLIALCRQGATSLDILIPYFGPGTMEIVRQEGQLATAEPMLKLLSRVLPTNGTKVSALLLDIHNTCERFYLSDTITPSLVDSASFILPIIQQGKKTVVFPDAGAYKRFQHLVHGSAIPVIVFCKTRIGEKREMVLQSTDDEEFKSENFIIWDDLVHSGNTLLECAKALRAIYAKDINIDVYITHCVMERNAHSLFLNTTLVNKVYTTDSVCHKMKTIRRHLDKFIIFPCMQLFHHATKDTRQPMDRYQKPLNVLLSSKSAIKVNAIKKSLFIWDSQGTVQSIDCNSDVNEQPIGWQEIIIGVLNRHQSLKQQCKLSNTYRYDANSFLVSIENGIVNINNKYCDVAIIVVETKAEGKTFIVKRCAEIPTKLMNLYEKQKIENKNSDPNFTFGQFMVDSNLSKDAKDWYTSLECNTESRQNSLIFPKKCLISFYHHTDILRHAIRMEKDF